MSGTALILAGHGSHVSANTAGIVWRYVDRLRSWRLADEIGACFWKEAPAFSQALGTVEADTIAVLPLFTARGYFTSEVLPAEMGLEGSVTVRAGKTIHLTRPLGEHPQLGSIVEGQLRATVKRYQLPPNETAAVIIGHGTRRNRQSRDSARHQARRIGSLNWLSEVVDVYLDDEPNIPSLYRRTRAPNIIALPYFMADGSHVRRDIPRALGISELDSVNRVRNRSVYYCEPVGVDESICQLILELARETGLPFLRQEAPGEWQHLPRGGRAALLRALDSEAILQFGQVMVSHKRAWHHANEAGGTVLSSAAALREYLRERPFRPLATSADLPSGWQVHYDEPECAHAVIETVYPGLVADWAAKKRGALATESLADIGKRQSGMFKDIQRLPADIIEQTLEQTCQNCIRQPSWWLDTDRDGGELPCRSACNLWLSTARKLEGAAS